MTPADFAKIYNVQPLYDAGINGIGQTIAIVGRSNIDVQNVRDFRTVLGLPPNDPEIIVNGDDRGQNSDMTEAMERRSDDANAVGEKSGMNDGSFQRSQK